MNVKHTPGPWEATRYGYRWDVEANRNLVVVVNPEGIGMDRAEANARLIASAPELLACLLDVLDADGDLNVMDFDRYRATVARATGENQ